MDETELKLSSSVHFVHSIVVEGPLNEIFFLLLLLCVVILIILLRLLLLLLLLLLLVRGLGGQTPAQQHMFGPVCCPMAALRHPNPRSAHVLGPRRVKAPVLVVYSTPKDYKVAMHFLSPKTSQPAHCCRVLSPTLGRLSCPEFLLVLSGLLAGRLLDRDHTRPIWLFSLCLLFRP